MVVATLMTLFLAGGLAITWRQNVELARQRDDARLQRAQAQYQLRRATASSNFMQAFLSTVPASGNGLRLEDLLDNARSLLATGYSGDTRFRARMLLELSDQYRLRDLAQDEKDLVHEALGLAIASGDDDLTAQAECRLALLPGEADSVLLARAEARLARSRAIDTRTSVYCHLAAARRIGRYDPQAAETRVRLAIRVAELGGDTVSQAAALALGRLRGRLLAANAGRSREGLAVARREVGLLGALGLAATRQAIQAKLGVAYALSRLGEVQAAAAVSAEVDSFAPRVDQVLRDNIYLTSARIALRRGRFAPYVRAAMLERAAAQGEGLALHVQFLSAGLAVVLSDSGAIVAARAALDRASTGASSELAARDARMLQAIVGVAKGALADAEGRYGDAVLLYRNEAALASPDAIFSDEHLTYRAARSALANRDAPLADSLGVRILQLLREAQHDEFRSADVGLALLLRARSRLILRDSVAAEALAQAAVMPLANGFGRDHQDTRAAVLLLDSLRLARRDG